MWTAYKLGPDSGVASRQAEPVKMKLEKQLPVSDFRVQAKWFGGFRSLAVAVRVLNKKKTIVTSQKYENTP